MFWIEVYAAGLILFNLWDAFIGFGFEFDTDFSKGPTAWFSSLFWPVVFPICLVMALGSVLLSVKERRLERKAQRLAKKEEAQRIRVAAEKEAQLFISQLDQELVHDKRNVGDTGANRKKARAR